MDELMTKAELLNLLQKSWTEWETLLDEFPPDQMTLPGAACEWSVKDNIAHLTHYTRCYADRIDEALHGIHYTPTPMDMLPYEERNDIIYEQHRSQPLAEVLAEARAAHEKLM